MHELLVIGLCFFAPRPAATISWRVDESQREPISSSACYGSTDEAQFHVLWPSDGLAMIGRRDVQRPLCCTLLFYPQ